MGKRIRIMRPLAQSSIISDTAGTVDEEAMEIERRHSKKRPVRELKP
jgi:hypothetical protein